MPCLLWWYRCSAQSPEHCSRCSVNELIHEMGIIVVGTFEQCGCQVLGTEPAHVATTTAPEVKH